MASSALWLAAVLASAGVAASQGLAYEYSAPMIPLQANVGSPDLFPMPKCKGFQLEEASIDQMQHAMASGQLTAVDLATCYMMRHMQTSQYIK